MAGRGGPRPNSGRPKKVDEEKSHKLCVQAIINVYGSIEAGIESILTGQYKDKDGNIKPQLISEKLQQFIWTHVLGNPETRTKLKVGDMDGNALPTSITVEVVRTIHNKDVVLNESADNNSA